MATITLDIPDFLADALAAEGKDPARVALEAMALEGYRTDQLSESEVRRMLGFETRMQVHAFLNQHKVCLHYTVEDLKHDIATAAEAARQYHESKSSSQNLNG